MGKVKNTPLNSNFLIAEKELSFGLKGLPAKLVASVLMKSLSLRKVNDLYRSAWGHEDPASQLLKLLDVKYTVNYTHLEKIPRKGSVIFVSNHPTGALDGIILIDLLSKIRPDIKFLGNYLLKRIDYLSEYFIAVDPFEDNRKNNISAVRQASAYLEQGGALGIFPAGEVSTWGKGTRSARDREWGNPILRLIYKSKTTIVPIFIDADNSTLFHLAGKLHPRLRTALLGRELMNKKGCSVRVEVGAPILPRMYSHALSFREFGDFLRANCEHLSSRVNQKGFKTVENLNSTPIHVASHIDKDILEDEINRIDPERILAVQGNLKLLCVSSHEIPHAMQEIGVLREETFRDAGEGTGKAIDIDRYDAYYRHLFIWDSHEREIIGSYRLGMGAEIVAEHDLKGFYTNSLFGMSEKMLPVMKESIELGRSFIISKYQRKATPLKLLWRGILTQLIRNPEYRYVLGPVTISGDYRMASRALIMHYLSKHHLQGDLSRYITPLNGCEEITTKHDMGLVDRIRSVEMIDKIIYDLESGHRGVPVLVKKYLQLKSKVLGFNVDRDFNNGLDALMILDINEIPQSVVEMLSRNTDALNET